MLATVQTIDISLVRWATDRAVAHAWSALTVFTVGELVILVFPLVLYLLWRIPAGPQQASRRRKAVVMAMVALVVALAAKSLIQFGFHRLRPFVADPTLNALPFPVDTYSFPSVHTLVAMTIAASLTLSGYRRLGWTLVGIALLIGIARIAAGVHYPTDIVAGAGIGWLVAWYLHREASTLKRYLPDS